MFEANLDLMCDWLNLELRYGFEKDYGTASFLLRLNMLKVPQNDGSSILKYIDSKWGRFNLFASEVEKTSDPQIALLALQQLGKLSNSNADKVTTMLWTKNNDESMSLDQTVSLIKEQAERVDFPSAVFLKMLRTRDFGGTLMAERIRELHYLVSRPHLDHTRALQLTLDNTVMSLHMWSAYIDNLRKKGLYKELPKPGRTSGEL